jgi:hypothetical protein
MSEPIRVDVSRDEDLADVARYLAARGFTVSTVHTEREVALDVTGSAPGHRSLESEVWDALTAWLAVTRCPLVPRAVREREYALTPPGE